MNKLNEEASAEYTRRRQSVLQALEEDDIAFFPAAPEAIRSADTHYPYRQDSDFYYLTGFLEPHAILVLSHEEQSFILFNQKRDPSQELWTGPRVGQDKAMDDYGAEAAYPIDTFKEKLPTLLRGKRRVFFPMGRYAHVDRMMMHGFHHARRQYRGMPQTLTDSADLLHPLRLIKNEYELKFMQKAAHISAIAHKRAMRVCRDCQYEYEIAAEMMYEMFRLGCEGLAYDSIVASGQHACILHYTANRARLGEQDLLLVDAGGEYSGYAADITRTFPINGRFNADQRTLYELVLHAQEAGIAVIRPGVPWNMIQDTIVKILTQGLLDLGILQGSLDEAIEHKTYETFYPHTSGHWLGLDVHDVGSYKKAKQSRLLETGMVLNR